MEDDASIPPLQTGIAHRTYLDLSLFHKKEAPQIIAELVAADPFVEDSRGAAECPDFSISGRIQKIPCTYGIPSNCLLTRNFNVKNMLVEERIPYHWYYDPKTNAWLGLLVEKKYENRFSGELKLRFFSESGYLNSNKSRKHGNYFHENKHKKKKKKKKKKKNKKSWQESALEKNRRLCRNKKPKMHYRDSGRFA